MAEISWAQPRWACLECGGAACQVPRQLGRGISVFPRSGCQGTEGQVCSTRPAPVSEFFVRGRGGLGDTHFISSTLKKAEADGRRSSCRTDRIVVESIGRRGGGMIFTVEGTSGFGKGDHEVQDHCHSEVPAGDESKRVEENTNSNGESFGMITRQLHQGHKKAVPGEGGIDNGTNVTSDKLHQEQKNAGPGVGGVGGVSGVRWSMLLSRNMLKDAHLSRASSVTDAHVLRRKGRLKEQDGLIEFIISLHHTHSAYQVMEKMEEWVQEHHDDHKRSSLRRLLPKLGRFYTPLPLVRALQEYDEFSSLSRRRFVPPNFADIRHILNIAQVHASSRHIKLLTFDADGTLYEDGHHIQRDSKMIDLIIKLIRDGVSVAIVTAAGYPGSAPHYEARFAGLLAAFQDMGLPPSITQHFHVMGGECNYLLCVKSDYHLEFVPDELWKTQDMLAWSEQDINSLLDEAQSALVSAATRLKLPVQLIRKPRAVGVVPKEPTIYEVLEEMTLAVQVELIDSNMPFCAFNGGSDVFVDVGNKSIGLEALMKFLGRRPAETLHIGDRFTISGNDSATRSKCSILWVANPEETNFYTRVLLREIQLAREFEKEDGALVLDVQAKASRSAKPQIL